jgi:hypothetical protein
MRQSKLRMNDQRSCKKATIMFYVFPAPITPATTRLNSGIP